MKNRLRALREDLDLRQADVAAATGIDQRTLSNYETGKTNPDSYALVTLADYFHVSIDYLLYHSPDPSAPTDKALEHLDDAMAALQACCEILKKT